MEDALIQEEPAQDTTLATEVMNEEAAWETEMANGLLSFQLQVTQDANCSSDMDGLDMDPELNTISLCYQDHELLFTCKSAEGSFASDLRQAWSAKTGFPAHVVNLIDMEYGEIFDDTMLVPPDTRLDVVLVFAGDARRDKGE